MKDNSKSMVYISFDRGDDLVRYSFVSHLSASLRRKGMIISSSFMDIKSSTESTENIKIEAFVVVVSEEYLLSTECLNELAEIVGCQQNNQTVVVVPVFYGISQLEVVQRSDILRDLLHQGDYSSDQISRWTSALKKVTDCYNKPSENPLALSLYAKLLSHKKPEEVEMEFLKLKKTPPCQIMKAFKSSYDTLSDNEKTMFLDIACFFRGEDADYVMKLFGGCGFFPHVGIYVLVEKCLVTISENKVQMHNMIEIIGREIANEETVQYKRHCRLWDASIIQPLLEDEETKSPLKSKDVEDIEAIFLETSNLHCFVKPIAFKNMYNLRFLKIYSSNPEKHQGLRLHKTLESLPNELRLLHWEDYPLQFLPQDFDPKHLVEINMPYSRLHKLWGGTKTLGMLKTIRLCHSEKLVDIDDLLKAQNIEVIDLQGCIRFQRFIATSHLQHLRVINLSGCVEIKSIPEIPPNIEELYLSETGIRVLTSNVTLSTQDKLHGRSCRELGDLQTEIPRLSKDLNLKHGDNDGCSSLVKVSSSNHDSLKILEMSGCSELKYIQGFPRNLKELYLSETDIRGVPSSISHLTALNILDM